MEDPKSKKRGNEGVGAPAKGDSSAGNTPLDPMDGATLADPPKASALAPKPTTRAANPDATISDSIAAMSSSTAGRWLSGVYRQEAILQAGDLIGARYEILQLLGEGGMGAVYKALDREVERTVALKLIRPELASNPAILARFKQELLTAHQVTHRNVIRIYDIAEADGVKYITMEFVEGQDLRHILIEKGKLPIEEAIEIIRQVCLALDAAHSAGVIHRDLKPQNIMRETKTGRILVMDFGLARTIGGDGMTQTGALLGTIEYMSPEQSMGKALDQRSDIFAVGLIFYELLVGKTPYKADTAMASLLKRNQERAIPAAELDASVPKALSDIVAKCLERELEHRYQNVQEILHDLDAFQGARPTLASISLPGIVRPKRPATWKWVAVGTLAVAMIGGGWLLKSVVVRSGTGSGASAVKGPELSLAILPFHNASGDASIDWLGGELSELLSTAVGQSSHMRTISPDRLHQIFGDLKIAANTDLDPDTINRIADFSNADTVVYGQYAKFGDKIQINATLEDRKHGRREPLRIEADNEKEIPATVDKLAELIRKNLSVSSAVLSEMKASSFQPSSKSAPALRDYNQAMQLVRDGKNLEAIKSFQSAIQADPQFALAYSRLAETDSALGYDADAEKYSRQALGLSQQLPVAEKYLIEANHAKVMKDNRKAIEAYENLAKTLPDSGDVEASLGGLYMEVGDYDKARAQFAKILQADPKNIRALWQMGMVEIKKENPQGALDPLNKGMSLAVQVDNQEQKAQLLQALGIAYRLMNKPEEAIKNFKDSMEINRALGLKRLLANNLEQMGQAQDSLGKPDEALASMTEALKIQKEIGIKKEVGDTLLSMGVVYYERENYDKALESFKASLQIQRETGDKKDESLCLNNIGFAYLNKGDNDNALTYLQQSLQIREQLNVPGDIADSLEGLGQAYTATGQYDNALASFLKAMELSRKAGNTRGEADASHQMGLLFGYQGRVGAAVSALQDAVKPIQGGNEIDPDIAGFWNDLGNALAKAGRGTEAGKPLEEAQKMAQDLKNDGLMSQVLNSQGNVKLFAGDYKGAKDSYQQALKLASKGTVRDNILVSKVNLDKVAIAEGRPQSVINELRALSQEADRLGIKHLSLESSVDMAGAMVNSKDYLHARQELERALDTSERLGSRLQTARIHYLLGTVIRLTDNGGEAAGQYEQALKLLDDIKKEAGAEHLMDRADLKAIYDDATRWSQAAKS
jgi:eukaryotic-like serine/threonine-protein kinase